MPETFVVLTPVHWLFLAGVIAVFLTMILRKDTPVVCIAFLFAIGAAGQHSITGGVQAVFTSVIYAISQFMEVIATIALITAFSKCLSDLGSDALLMRPMSRVMRTPCVSWWLLGFTMFLFSLFLWPSPSVALVGAIILPIAVHSGLSPLLAAMAMNLAGHGFALSYDAVIQGAPAISARAAGISASDILAQGRPLFLVMGLGTVLAAFFLNRRAITDRSGISASQNRTPNNSRPDAHSGSVSSTSGQQDPESGILRERSVSRQAVFLAVFTPIAFLSDIILMLLLNLKGGDATSLVAGTAVLLMCLGAVLEFRSGSLEKVTEYLTDGFLFAIRIFAPVIVIGAFFFLGGDGISQILGDSFEGGILNDWALWLAGHAPLNRYMTALLQLIIGGLTGLDGSGFSGLPLTGALARTFGTATASSIPVLAALGQISAIFIGGGTIVPWGLIPVAAICNVSPIELARKNMLPVFIGLACTFAVACFLL